VCSELEGRGSEARRCVAPLAILIELRREITLVIISMACGAFADHDFRRLACGPNACSFVASFTGHIRVPAGKLE
jgi:hypothetical protein